MSRLLGAADVRRIATELDIRPAKKWGQNFVIDPNTVERIVRVANVSRDDVVLEVGPGLGSLTLALLRPGAQVVAVEIDARLADRLTRTISEFDPAAIDRLAVVNADALEVRQLRSAPTMLVANLPYNVSVPVVLHLPIKHFNVFRYTVAKNMNADFLKCSMHHKRLLYGYSVILGLLTFRNAFALFHSIYKVTNLINRFATRHER